MTERVLPHLPKWPFLAGDALLLGCALALYGQAAKPLGLWDVCALAGCVVVGAVCGMLPFILEYRAAVKLALADTLETTIAQIQKLEALAAQINTATNHWQIVQDAAEKTAAGAQQFSERMSSEVKAFTEFMGRANEAEKSNLRLEVEKLKRAEGDWLQVLVRMLDHVYALHQGAVRSGQQNVIQQVDRFQHACRDAARRVGLIPFGAAAEEKFDPQRHHLADSNAQAGPDAVVEENLATGYTFQGQIVRPALVRLRQNGAAMPAEPAQDQLPLEGS